MPVRYSAINKQGGPPSGGQSSMMATVMVTAATCNQKEKVQKHVNIEETTSLSGECLKKRIILVLHRKKRFVTVGFREKT
jgi:hypothetical protein